MSWELPYIPHPLDDVVAWIVMGSILFPAAAIVWRRGVMVIWTASRRLFRIVEQMDQANEYLSRLVEALPVLVEIADQFKPDGGASLHDQLEMIRAQQADLMQQMEAHLQLDHGR